MRGKERRFGRRSVLWSNIVRRRRRSQLFSTGAVVSLSPGDELTELWRAEVSYIGIACTYKIPKKCRILTYYVKIRALSSSDVNVEERRRKRLLSPPLELRSIERKVN